MSIRGLGFGSANKLIMEIKTLDDQNLPEVVEPCICEEWVEKFAEKFNLSIDRVRKLFSEGRELRIDWIRRRLMLGYRAKISYEREKPIGFIDYVPVETEEEGISGRDITLINCILIIPGYRGKGYGRILLKEAERDAEKTRRGIAVIAHEHERWMPASYFLKRGYKEVDRQGEEFKRILMLKAFREVEPPKFMEQEHSRPESVSGKIVVEISWSGRCPHNLISVELLKNVLAEFGDRLVIKEMMTNDLTSEVIRKYGRGCGVYINGEPKFWLLGASEEEIRHEIKSVLQGTADPSYG